MAELEPASHSLRLGAGMVGGKPRAELVAERALARGEGQVHTCLGSIFGDTRSEVKHRLRMCTPPHG